jgi:hypothetical protein
MRLFASLALVVSSLIGVSCHETDRSILVTETRELTLFDRTYPGKIKDYPPLAWRRIHGTQMRALNYLAGPDDSVQIFMGTSGGGVLGNVNRWLDQYGVSTPASLESLEKIEVLGREAYLVEATGDFGGGMGQLPKKNQSVMGLVRSQGGEDVLTLKMTGPAKAVAAERERFIAYAKALEVFSPEVFDEPS